MNIILTKGSTKMTLARPDVVEPYYRGTRFDRSGVVLDLESGGHSFVSQWFLHYDPYMHDAVGGPAEEFTQTGYEDVRPGEGFLKVGVGLLERKAEVYDRFKLYKVLDEGVRRVETTEDSASFRQILDAGGYGYDYLKTLTLPQDGVLRIDHRLRNTSEKPLEIYVYNHNFFILDGASTGRNTEFDFPFRPSGHWRADYDCVALAENGIRFSRDLQPGESVFMGDLKPDTPQEKYHFRLSNKAKGLSVEVQSNAAMEYAVFWCNHEVACMEPYTRLHIGAGCVSEWYIEYRFQVGCH